MTVYDLFTLSSLLALINAESLAIESKIKSNYFDPVLSASSYVGHMKENERIVQLEPSLFATDDDPSNSLNGFFIILLINFY